MRKVVMMLFAVGFLISLGHSQKAQAQNESYTAILATSNAGAKQIRFNFTITKYTTDDELKQLVAILKDKGQDALVDALRKLDAGRINQVGDTGNQIAIAEKAQSGKETTITIVTARRISVSEQQRKAKHADYPLGYLTVTLNEAGEGNGKAMTAAKIKFDKEKGSYKLEPYGNGYTPVTNVTTSK